MTMNLRHALTALCLIVIVLVTGWTIGQAILAELPTADADTPARTEYMPCSGEADGVNCIWDARHMGNGEGHSFFVRKDGSILYLDHHIAHYLLYR